MSEGPPKQLVNTEAEKEPTRREKIIALALELNENHEGFPFPGIEPEAYEKIKAGIEAEKDATDYDISSPTLDELIARFNKEGMKVFPGKYPESGNVSVLPMGSDETGEDIKYDSILPKNLRITEGMDSKLKELILLSRS